MITVNAPRTQNALILLEETAADLMTPNPVSVRENATVQEAINLLADKGFSAAPVINEAGRPVGALSQTDIVLHDRNQFRYAATADFFVRTDLNIPEGMQDVDCFPLETETCVRDVMTPAVLAVAPTDSVEQVVAEMVAFRVHRLFVVDEAGVLVGVISAFDVLRKLRKKSDGGHIHQETRL